MIEGKNSQGETGLGYMFSGIEKESISSELDMIYESDQDARINGNKEIVDKRNLEKVEYILKFSAEYLKNNCNKKNFLTIWLVLQHSDYRTLKKYLPFLEKISNGNLLLPEYLALSIDRVLVGDGEGQVYGSQITRKDITGSWELAKIKDIRHVDIRRNNMGMQSLSEYLSEMNVDIIMSDEQKNFLKNGGQQFIEIRENT